MFMSKIPAGGAPSTLKSQRRDGDVGCAPFRWAVHARAVSDSDFLPLFALRASGLPIFHVSLSQRAAEDAIE